MFERVRHMVVKEFIQVLRDPKMKGIVFVMPLIQLFIFGYAVSTDVNDIETAVQDRDNSVASRDLIARFERSGYFIIEEHIADDDRVAQLMDSGEVRTVLRIDKGFEARLKAGRTAELQAIIDGTDSTTASVAVQYSGRIIDEYAAEAARTQARRLKGTFEDPRPLRLETRAWFNENLESRPFYVPGVIVLMVTLVTLMLTSMAVVREKEIGTLEQVMVTPIRPLEFVLGKTVPFALIGFVDATVVLLVGVLWFNVPVRGSIPLLYFALSIYLLTTLGVGLFISTVSSTQQQAMMTTFLFFLPAMLLSGFAFPIENMPPVIRWLTLANPLRHFLVIIRGVFLKGVGPAILWPQILALAAVGLAAFTTSFIRVKRSLL